MPAVGIWLGATGVADVVADLSGHPSSGARILAAWIAGVVLSLAGGLVVGYDLAASLLLALVTGATLAAWLWVRSARAWTVRRAMLAFWIGVASLVGLLITAPLWPESAGGLLGRWLREAPFRAIAAQTPEHAALVTGWLIWLGASANAVVRLVLAIVERDVPPGKEPLKGGRIIGPMERWLIIGLVLAGTATAAGLVVAAKGLIRYAEIRGQDIAWKTEYLLIGSLTSWLLALAPVVLLA